MEVRTMYQVLKRDGGTMEFDISKISAAMIKAKHRTRITTPV